MFGVGSRGNVSYAKHLAVFMGKARVGLHESAVMERRGDAGRGVGLFVRDACDASTSIAVVPNDRIVCCETLKAVGCNYPLKGDAAGLDVLPRISELEGEGLGYRTGVIACLLGCDRDMAWAELAWRIGLERCGSHSFWWGWLDGLPSAKAMAAAKAACGDTIRARYPQLHAHWSQWDAKIEAEVDEWYGRLEQHLTMPPRWAFGWAVRIILSRASTLIQPCGGADGLSGFRKQLGILPVVDLCNTANTCLIEGFEESLEAFIDKTYEAANATIGPDGQLPPALAPARLAQTFLQLQSKDNTFFYPPASSSRGSSKMLTAAAASYISLDNATVELAPTWEDLPRWYQDLIMAGTLEKEHTSTVGMTSAGADSFGETGGRTGAALNGLFPAFVLTLTKDVQAGEEILVPYEVPHAIEMVPQQPKADHAMRVWSRYNIVP